MSRDASEILGAPLLAGVRINPGGTAKEGVAVAAAGTWGGDAPRFGRFGYLAVTEDEVVLIRMETGILTPKFAEVVARVARSEIVSAELGRTIMGFGEKLTLGFSIPLTIKFADGGSWQLEVPRLPRAEEGGSPLNPKRAREIVDLLDKRRPGS